MNEISPYILEKYKNLYQKDPQSKIFAPLAEAYRRIGFQEKAIEICEEGLKNHPHFAEGYVALAKIYFEQKNFKKAALFFKKATELSPENLQAHKQLAQCYLNLRSPKQALSSYKMLLFLNPHDLQAKKAVKKLDNLTADEYKEDLFLNLESLTDESKNNPLELEETSHSPPLLPHRELDRFLSLADAFIVRGDINRAKEVLNEAERVLGPTTEIEYRIQLIERGDDSDAPGPLQEVKWEEPFFSHRTKAKIDREKKIKNLKTLLNRIKKRAKY